MSLFTALTNIKVLLFAQRCLGKASELLKVPTQEATLHKNPKLNLPPSPPLEEHDVLLNITFFNVFS